MQGRGSIHYHALLGGDGLQDARRLTFMDEWSRMLERRVDGRSELGGISRIEAPKSELAVARYCAKYTAKGFDIDLCPRLTLATQAMRQTLLSDVARDVNTSRRVARRVDRERTPTVSGQTSGTH